MNVKEIYKILAIALGYCIMFACFIIFDENIESRVKILDIVASCIIYTQFVQFVLFPLMNLDDPSKKEVGMMGIHIVALNFCCVLSICIMVVGIMYMIPFKYQIMVQLVVLFFLLIGRVATLGSGEKVQDIFVKEQQTIAGKVSLRMNMDDFIDYVATVHDLDSNIKKRLSSLHDNMRFITPSTNKEAMYWDTQVLNTLEDLKVLMRNASMNKDMIETNIGQLERFMARRKKY